MNSKILDLFSSTWAQGERLTADAPLLYEIIYILISMQIYVNKADGKLFI